MKTIFTIQVNTPDGRMMDLQAEHRFLTDAINHADRVAARAPKGTTVTVFENGRKVRA